MFHLSKKAIKAIDKPAIRNLIAYALGCSEKTIIRYINSNDDCLTKAAAMEVIRKHTGMKDGEILVRLRNAA